MSGEEEIRERLLHGSLRSKAYAAMAMYSRGMYAEPLIDLLIDALEDTAAKEGDYTKDELGFFMFGIIALSRCIQEASKPGTLSPVRKKAESELIKLARAGNEEISLTAMYHLGQLREAGQFAIQAVLGRRVHEPVHITYPSGITLRASAYRAIIKIDPEYARSLGDVPARSELRNALEFWISEASRSTSREALQSELMNLESITS